MAIDDYGASPGDVESPQNIADYDWPRSVDEKWRPVGCTPEYDVYGVVTWDAVEVDWIDKTWTGRKTGNSMFEYDVGAVHSPRGTPRTKVDQNDRGGTSWSCDNVDVAPS